MGDMHTCEACIKYILQVYFLPVLYFLNEIGDYLKLMKTDQIILEACRILLLFSLNFYLFVC